MKHVIAILGILFLIFLIIIPLYCYHNFGGSQWEAMYVVIFPLIVGWGYVLDGWYKEY